MKRIIIGLVAIIAVAGAAGYFYIENIKKTVGVPTVPQLVSRIEGAMATQDLMALAHFNYEYAKRVDRLAFGPDQSSSALTPAQGQHPLIDALLGKGVDIRKDLSHIVAGVHVNNTGLMRTVVLTGNFKIKNITDAMSRVYQVEKASIGAGVLEVRPNDPDNCTKRDPFYVQVRNDTIIISDEKFFSRFFSRFHSKTTLNTSRIKDWPAFRNGKIFSAAVFSPDKILSKTPMAMLQSKDPNDLLNQVQAVYVGGALEVVYPRGLHLSTYVNTRTPAAAQKVTQAFQSGLASLAQNYGEISPTIHQLSQLFTAEAAGQQAMIKANLTEETVPLLVKVPAEFVSFLTQQMGISTVGSSPVQEQTVPAEKLPIYRANVAKQDLPNFTDQHNFFGADQISGPFAIKLAKASWTSLESHDAVELTLEIKSSPLPNILVENMHRSDKAASAFFHMQDILDHDAYSILFPDPCGQDRYNKPVALQHGTMSHFEDGVQKELHYLYGTKTVRLDKNANLKNIAKIFASVELNLPTATKTQKLALPLDNKSFAFNGGKIIFKSAKDGSLSYQIHGQMNNVLDIRALNTEGKYLAEQSAMSMSGLTRNVKSISKDFAGKIASLEIVTAEKTEKIKYPIEMQQFFTKFVEKNENLATTQKVQEGTAMTHARENKPMRYHNLCKDRFEYNLKFGALCLNKLSKVSTEGVMGEFELFLDDSPALYRNISGYEIALTHLFAKMKNGKVYEVPFISNTMPKLRQRKAGSRSILYTSSAPFGAWRGYPAFKDAVEIIGVRGNMNNRFPHRIKKERIPALRVGHHILTRKGLSVTVGEVENGRIHLDILGNISTLVQIIPITLDGKALELQNLTIRDTGENTKRMSFDVHALPIYLDIYHATSQDLRQHPIYFRTDGVEVDMSVFTEKVRNAYEESEFDQMLKDENAAIRSNIKEAVEINPIVPETVEEMKEKARIQKELEQMEEEFGGSIDNDNPSLESEIILNQSLGLE